MTAVEMAKEIDGYYGFLSEAIDKDNPSGLVADLDRRCQILARSAVLLADAQRILDRARGEAAHKLPPDMSATLAREHLNFVCADEARLLKLADRLNATLVHQIDAIRSVLSWEKQLKATDR